MIKRSCIYGIIGLIIIPCLTCYILSFFMGINAIWYSYFIGDAFSTVLFLIYAAFKLKRIPKNMKEWIYIPHEYLALMDDSDPTKNVGLKLVSGLAKDMCYSAPFGFNLLTVEL